MLFPIRTTAHIGLVSWETSSFRTLFACLGTMEAYLGMAPREIAGGEGWRSLDASVYLGGRAYLRCLPAALPTTVHLWHCGEEWVQQTNRVPIQDLEAAISTMLLLEGQGRHRDVFHLAQWLHTFLAWEQRVQLCQELLRGGVCQLPFPLAYVLIDADDRYAAYAAAQENDGIPYYLPHGAH